jgi:hypothetical protein
MPVERGGVTQELESLRVHEREGRSQTSGRLAPSVHYLGKCRALCDRNSVMPVELDHRETGTRRDERP